MKTILITITAVLLLTGLAPVRTTWADSDYQQEVYDTQTSDTLFTPDELHDLLAPIALYPDPLIAQMLPAATYIDQIDEAARYVRQYGKSARIDDQPWDVSVRAVAHYPDVLFMMDRKYDWSVSLGQAFVNQQQDVMDAFQRLREEAQATGNLVTSPQQQVIDEGGTISIVPAAADVIYVPQYDPLVVYVERPYPAYGFVTFSAGFTIGVWLNRDCDWRGHRVYYHGWRGGGWISRARPHVRDRNHIYINNNFTVITTNRRVIQHDTHRFREDIRRNVQERRERGGQPPPSRGREQRPHNQGTGGKVMPPRPVIRPPTPAIQTPAAPVQTPRPAVQAPRPTVQTPLPAAQAPRPTVQAPRPATAAPGRPQPQDNNNLYRGREPQGAPPAQLGGYGGYGSKGEAKTYRERGQTSRENIRPATSQQPVPVRSQTPAPAPAPRQGISPGGRQSTTPPAQQPAGRGGEEKRQQR